ncbi:MAG: restriction endonuclease [Candidatus Kapabacteria bacterium]|nr:restriction endonuclease [Candidatus Kapabacteria bacterium]
MEKIQSKEVLIKKANGEIEAFSDIKLRRSLKNAGANLETQDEIVYDIQNLIYDGVTTKKIYDWAFSILDRKQQLSSIRYKLKQAMLELGPTGFPFEQIISIIFARQAYNTQVGQIVEGYCVSHEMDVVATSANHQCLIECKYSTDQGKRVSIQTPLYVRSRVEDIIKLRQKMPEYKDFSFSGWIITNTRFSDDSIKYARCSGLKLLGWDYPEGNGLKEHLERENIFPVTFLTNLTIIQKQHLFEHGIVVCRQLLNKMEILESFHLDKQKMDLLINELNVIESLSRELL